MPYPDQKQGGFRRTHQPGYAMYSTDPRPLCDKSAEDC